MVLPIRRTGNMKEFEILIFFRFDVHCVHKRLHGVLCRPVPHSMFFFFPACLIRNLSFSSNGFSWSCSHESDNGIRLLTDQALGSHLVGIVFLLSLVAESPLPRLRDD